MSSDKVTVAFTIRKKTLWTILGILLGLLTVWPIVYIYLPVSTSSSASAPSAPLTCSSSTCTIVITNSQFGPLSQNPFYIKVGTTVTWVNHDPTQHTSTSDTGVWGSPILNPGNSFSFTFTSPGTYPYHCNIHPMTGTIVVES
jgi:plastocyanin